MNNCFVRLYDWFCGHRRLLYLLLVVWLAGSGLLASRMRFVEDITNFFSDDESGQKQALVFKNLRLKDRMVVLLEDDDPDRMIEAAGQVVEALAPLVDEGLLLRVMEGVDASTVDRSAAFIYDYLPSFLTDADYVRIEASLDEGSVRQAVRRCFEVMTSPSGLFAGEICLRDPLGLGTPLLAGLSRFGGQADYELYADHVFAKDFSALFLFADPANGMGSTGANDELIRRMEQALAEVSARTGVAASYFGGSAVAVYNARQIKRDTTITLTVALVLVVLVITLSLRDRGAVVLIVVPVVFGALFALAAIYLLQGRISSIAIGAGAAVFGIALSYSIHVVSHRTHADDPRQVIAELAYPMTVGSFTTIGAFVALLFTHSRLLQDFGAFASLTLIGTTLFCLIFLPHFLSRGTHRPGRMLRLVDRINGYAYERNRWLVGGIAVVTIGCAFFYDDVRFDSDLHRLNFEPKHIADAERKLERLTGNSDARVFLVTSAGSAEQTGQAYGRLAAQLAALEREGRILSSITIGDYFVAPAEQQRRIERWNAFWQDRRDALVARIDRAAADAGFSEGAFDAFTDLLSREYTVCGYSHEELADVPLFSDWIDTADSSFLLVSQIELREEQKPLVYASLEQCDDTAIVDRGYYSSRMVDDINEDFYFILFVSSLLVFGALLLSYGRIELALLSLLPMLVSWVIILGCMALLEIPFNIVNIILSTFIFGIGDDFSIFIMDGLLCEYGEGRRLFNAHKTAIFFSAFTTIAGLGALIFAGHPALKSIALISVLGLGVVILVSYTLQPVLFRCFVSGPARRGDFPYALRDLVRTLYAFVYFLLGCVAAQAFIVASLLVPVRRERKQLWLHRCVCAFARFFLQTIPATRVERPNDAQERFDRPAVILANHQSFIDILLLLAATPKIVMVTNGWVWRSPFFGPIVRYFGCFRTGDGYETAVDRLRDKVAAGYSVVVFPEGTRSADRSIGRFHKGAFYLAEQLRLDIVPIVIYGAGMVSSKRQGFYIKPGRVVARIFPRTACGDARFGTTLREQAKAWRSWYRMQYAALCDRYDRADNPYFRDALRKNYLYKGPLVMAQVCREARRECYYEAWDRAVPRTGIVTEIGCGYGARTLMLGMLSRSRTMIGLDRAEERLRLVEHCFLKGANISFAHLCEEALPESDAFLLHAFCPELLECCLGRLRPDGIVLLDGVQPGEVAEFAARHRLEVRTTEEGLISIRHA